MAVAAFASMIYSFIYTFTAYLIPAYQTFKAVERKGVSANDVRQWGIYWVVFAVFVSTQWLLDVLLRWLPFYYLLKLVFITLLWYPNVQLAQTAYMKAFSPLLLSYEADIDKFVAEGRVKFFDLVGQHAGKAKEVIRDASGKLTIMAKDLKEKALAKAKHGPKRGPTVGVADATSGLHTE